MRIIPLVFVLFVGFGVFAQSQETASAQTGPKIAFKETEHAFGDINQGDVVEHNFMYYNKGNAPLLLSNVHVTCGCTAPNWERKPLAPGDSAILHVKFNSAHKSGMQNKVITVSSNAVNDIEKVKITANVLLEAKEETER